MIAVPFGLLVALPSLRIGDLYLALLTLGFALLIEQFVWTAHRVRRTSARALHDRRGRSASASPTGWRCTRSSRWCSRSSRSLIVNLKRATSGLVFASIRSSEPASLTSGISIVRAKLVLFGVERVRRRLRRRALRRPSSAPRTPTLVQRARRHRVARHRRDVGRALGRRRAPRRHDLRHRAATPLASSSS